MKPVQMRILYPGRSRDSAEKIIAGSAVGREIKRFSKIFLVGIIKLWTIWKQKKTTKRQSRSDILFRVPQWTYSWKCEPRRSFEIIHPSSRVNKISVEEDLCSNKERASLSFFFSVSCQSMKVLLLKNISSGIERASRGL